VVAASSWSKHFEAVRKRRRKDGKKEKIGSIGKHLIKKNAAIEGQNPFLKNDRRQL